MLLEPPLQREASQPNYTKGRGKSRKGWQRGRCSTWLAGIRGRCRWPAGRGERQFMLICSSLDWRAWKDEGKKNIKEDGRGKNNRISTREFRKENWLAEEEKERQEDEEEDLGTSEQSKTGVTKEEGRRKYDRVYRSCGNRCVAVMSLPWHLQLLLHPFLQIHSRGLLIYTRCLLP